MDHDEVVKEIIRRAWSFGVPVLMSPKKNVKIEDDQVCGGYFAGGSDPSLAVATGRGPQTLGILLHEYSHLTQWVEQCPVWIASEKAKDWGPWLAGKRMKDPKSAIEASRDLEADCERRTIRLIQELDAPIDLENYTRGANAYIHFHNVMLEKRKWYKDGLGPYHHPEILALANPTFDLDHSKTPRKLFNAIATRLE